MRQTICCFSGLEIREGSLNANLDKLLERLIIITAATYIAGGPCELHYFTL